MRFKLTEWVRDPQGGREDSPDGRFFLWGHTLEYHLYDNLDLVTYGPFRTLRRVRRQIMEILSQDHKRPLSEEANEEVLEFIRRFG